MFSKACLSSILFISIVGLFLRAGSVHAQPNTTFERLFNEILSVVNTDIVNAGSFDQAAERANQRFTPALNNLIAGNVASFPLTSSIAALNVVLDSTLVRPIFSREGLGPVFGETAQTIGRKKVNLGFNYSYYDLVQFRGLDTRDFRFTLTSADLDGNGRLGDNDEPAESETLDIYPDLRLSAATFVFYGTVGVLKNLDVGVAIPFITLRLEGTARAVINSTTLFSGGAAINIFEGDPINPILENQQSYQESAAGLGDIALRVKYALVREKDVDVAAFAEVRLPTGDKDDFLSTGDVNARFTGILSKKLGDNFLSHLNLGYDYRGADFDSDEIDFNVGFNHKMGDKVTLVLEVMGDYDLSTDKLTPPLLETQTLNVEVFVDDDEPPARADIGVDLSNLPRRDRDNVLNLSVGCKVAPSSRYSFLANILIPLQDGGLRSRVIPTLGVAANF